jgi:peptidase E
MKSPLVKPIFLLAGGRGSRRTGADPLLQAVFASTGINHPTIAYLGPACNDDAGFFAMLSQYFTAAGAGTIKLVPTVKKFDRESAIKRVSDADCIFISGGDVEEGMRIINQRNLVPLLKDLHKQGKQFFGLSAGSIMLARQWVRWTDDNDDDSAELFDCISLAPVCCDTHGEADGWDEIKALLKLARDGTIGYGIATNTALRVDSDGSIIALGGAVQQFTKRNGRVIQMDDLKPVKS